jgi:uncharacterized protein YoxC
MQQRLESLEEEMETVKDLLMSAARYAESANQRLDRVSVQQETNTLAIGQLVNAVSRLTETSDQALKAIQEMQSEVRGLQTENRRILDRLERHMGDGHGVEQ